MEKIYIFLNSNLYSNFTQYRREKSTKLKQFYVCSLHLNKECINTILVYFLNNNCACALDVGNRCKNRRNKHAQLNIQY